MSERRVRVANSPAGVGRGVFAEVDFGAGDVVERCPVIIVPASQLPHLDRTDIYDYYFSWSDGAAAIALGFGSIYNHSFRPNARYDSSIESLEIVITAIEPILAGEEIFVNYNGAPELTSPLWFDAIEPRD